MKKKTKRKLRIANSAKHPLFMMMNFEIHRYFLDSTAGRCDGGQRAHNHLLMARKYCAVRDSITELDAVPHREVMRVHDNTQAFTNDLYKSVGYPCHDPSAVHDIESKYAMKFFELFLKFAEKDKERGEYSIGGRSWLIFDEE